MAPIHLSPPIPPLRAFSEQHPDDHESDIQLPAASLPVKAAEKWSAIALVGANRFFTTAGLILLLRGIPALFQRRSIISRTGVVEALQTGAFLGTCSIVTNSVLKLSRSPALAGLLGGISVAVLSVTARSYAASYACVRALEIICRQAVHKGFLPELPHADVLLAMAGSSQIIWMWIAAPKYVDSAYLKFLDFQGAKSRVVLHGIASLHHIDHYYGAPVDVEALSTSLAARVARERALGGSVPNCCDASPFVGLHHPNAHCHMVHPECPSCLVHFLLFLKDAYSRALTLYAPFFIFPIFVLRAVALYKTPTKLRSAIVTYVTNVLRSSLFLSGYDETL